MNYIFPIIRKDLNATHDYDNYSAWNVSCLVLIFASHCPLRRMNIMEHGSNLTPGNIFRWKTTACVIVFALLLPAFSSSIEDDRFLPFIEKYAYGNIDWDSGIIYGIGRGYLHLNKNSQSIALRAAQVVAAGNILKVAAGVRLDDRRTLEALGKDRVVIELKALVRYKLHKTEFIKDVKQPYYEVTLSAPITGIEGLTSMLITKLKTVPLDWLNLPKPSDESVSDDEEKPWLVLDARNLPKKGQAKPAIFPKIISESGETLYETSKVDEPALVKRGMARYVVSDEPKEGLTPKKNLLTRSLLKPDFCFLQMKLSQVITKKEPGGKIIL